MAKQYSKLSWLFLLIIAAPSTLAYYRNTGISPLNRLMELLGVMGNIPALLSENVQVGLLRVLLFIVFMSVARLALKYSGKIFSGAEGNKTASIIAGVFAAIGAFMMPEAWVIGNGGVIASIFAALIPLGLAAGVIYVSVTKLNQSTPQRLIAIVLLLTVLAIIQMWFDVTGAVDYQSGSRISTGNPGIAATTSSPPSSGGSSTETAPENQRNTGETEPPPANTDITQPSTLV